MIRLVDGSNLIHRKLWNMDGDMNFGVHPIRDLYLRFMMGDHKTLIVWDGMHSNVRRREIFSGYKANRPEKDENIMAMFDMTKEILCHCPVTQIEIPYWEADDVIFTLATSGMIQDDIIIETNDQDYWQIEDAKLPLVTPPPCERRHTVLYKALIGDKSDNIHGWRGFGPKRWEQMAGFYDMMEQCLVTEDYEKWQLIPWPKGIVADYGSFFECCMFYRIIRMWNVPENEFEGNVVLGQQRPVLAEEILYEYHI